MENAIVDDALRGWAQGLLDRGVEVVGLIDACHSATGFRAVSGVGVARAVDDRRLGIPAPVIPVAGDPAPALSGRFVSFIPRNPISGRWNIRWPMAAPAI